MTPEQVKNMIQEAAQIEVQKIDGRFSSIDIHLHNQDIALAELKVLLEDKDFLTKLWRLVKNIFMGIFTIGSAYLLYKQLK
jgi:hypothetical protein